MVRGDVHAIKLSRGRGRVQGGEPTSVLCEMVGTVDARALGGQIGHLSFGLLVAHAPDHRSVSAD